MAKLLARNRYLPYTSKHMNWAKKRKLTIALIILTPLVIAAGILVYLNRPAPTCFDGKQNQDELGIDCGGVCEEVCQDLVDMPVVEWVRHFYISQGNYGAVAIVRNPDSQLSAHDVPYQLRFYNEENLLIKEQTGTVYVPALAEFPLFFKDVDLGNQVPVRATFSFPEKPYWNEVGESAAADVDTEWQELTEARNGFMRLDAAVRNNSKEIVDNIAFVAILYDSEGNVRHASQSVTEPIFVNERKPLVFTWPEPLDREVVRVEVRATKLRE